MVRYCHVAHQTDSVLDTRAGRIVHETDTLDFILMLAYVPKGMMPFQVPFLESDPLHLFVKASWEYVRFHLVVCILCSPHGSET